MEKLQNILCIRADNMGDVLMSTPAFRALKETFCCRLTLLTSHAGSLIAPFIKEIDETLVFNLPWIKTTHLIQTNQCLKLIEVLKSCRFDAAIIFTVYSQSSLPSALIAYMANIPLRLAYCRENPYDLLTHWIPDKEPYTFIQHQVKRDLQLVQTIDASTKDEQLSVCFDKKAYNTAVEKLNRINFNSNKKFIVVHAGVSEVKRMYPTQLWIDAINSIQQHQNIQILLTGSKDECTITQEIKQSTNKNVFSVAGLLNVEEFIAVVANSEVVVSVNTATVHIAAALQKPVVVLYAQTNPQHTPWFTKNIVLPYSVPVELKSKNEVIRFVDKKHFNKQIDFPSPKKITESVFELMKENQVQFNKQLIVST